MIDKKYPMYRHQFEMLPNFGYYELNAMILTSVIMIIGGCIQSTLTVSLLAFQMLVLRFVSNLEEIKFSF
ncbi:hypothetical protein L5515_008560 [Caenorhabditis briggsae]|uniref:Uncharacterized protein n=1 Tax=Caenorhabditis briggsae TaxID=6238 RepID=A0AAE9F7T8_CAEBR|nr:hypothetical protein L5515_008560 [Caenorhabditis briggsae]